MSTARVAVVGSFVVGMTLHADRFPVPGETVLAKYFDLGPGGKGSNQACVGDVSEEDRAAVRQQAAKLIDKAQRALVPAARGT